MNQNIWSGLTTATLLISFLGTASASYADQSTSRSAETQATAQQSTPSRVASTAPASSGTEQSQPGQETEAVKVGEYQSQASANSETSIATIHPHQVAGRQAATLYVRGIPVLTFLGSSRTASVPTGDSTAASADVKIASFQSVSSPNRSTAQSAQPTLDESASSKVSSNGSGDDPVARATQLAARLNDLYRDSLDANKINVAWDDNRQRYVIKAGDSELVALSANTILPDTTRNAAEDALQITNRLRRQMGNAAPLPGISGGPQGGVTQVSLGPVRFTIRGLASWYGPGFDGAHSASGEVFNQNALTAAHPSLPFGTQVRVTNMDNGRSVVVRINDRGPYAADRVIDLSTGAARVIGLVQSGVAPVSIEVLGTATAYRPN